MIPWSGDYRDVRVRGNTISAFGAYIRGGINVGPAVWGDDTEGIVRGGTITNNLIEGDHIGYGIVVTSAKDFTITKNKSTAKYSGFKGPTCPTAPENADPMAFLINRGSSQGTFQSDFVNGEVQHGECGFKIYPDFRTQLLTAPPPLVSAVICIDPVTEDGEPYKPWRLRDSPIAIEASIEESGGPSNPTVDAGLTEGLVSYQMVLMEAMNAVSDKLKVAVATEEKSRQKGGGGRDGRKSKSPFTAALTDLSTRLANLEAEKKSVRNSFDKMKTDLKEYVRGLQTYKQDQTGLLDDVLDLARTGYASKDAVDVSWKNQGLRNRDSTRASPDDLPLPTADDNSVWAPIVVFLLLQSILIGLVFSINSLIKRKRGFSSKSGYRDRGRSFPIHTGSGRPTRPWFNFFRGLIPSSKRTMSVHALSQPLPKSHSQSQSHVSTLSHSMQRGHSSHESSELFAAYDQSVRGQDRERGHGYPSSIVSVNASARCATPPNMSPKVREMFISLEGE